MLIDATCLVVIWVIVHGIIIFWLHYFGHMNTVILGWRVMLCLKLLSFRWFVILDLISQITSIALFLDSSLMILLSDLLLSGSNLISHLSLCLRSFLCTLSLLALDGVGVLISHQIVQVSLGLECLLFCFLLHWLNLLYCSKFRRCSFDRLNLSVSLLVVDSLLVLKIIGGVASLVSYELVTGVAFKFKTTAELVFSDVFFFLRFTLIITLQHLIL